MRHLVTLPLRLTSLALVCSAFTFAGDTFAQKAPVYRCQNGDRVEYSNEPCLGARVVDTTATRGLDKDSGRQRKGKDVQREERREVMAEALKPLTGMDAQQTAKFGARLKLEPAVRRECADLDAKLPPLERSAAKAAAAEKGAADASLFIARNRFRALGC